MKTSHTPGPWTDDGHSGTTEQIIINSQWGEVARVTMAGDYPQRDANARLIATAPELLKTAAELLRAYDTQYGKLIAGSMAFADAYLALHNAIAKATQP